MFRRGGNKAFESGKMPAEWRKSVFKNKADVQSCGNSRGLNVMSHTMKSWEIIVEARGQKFAFESNSLVAHKCKLGCFRAWSGHWSEVTARDVNAYHTKALKQPDLRIFKTFNSRF